MDESFLLIVEMSSCCVDVESNSLGHWGFICVATASIH